MANRHYKWHGIDQKGQMLCGELDAQNKAEVTTALRLQRIRATRIQRRFELPAKLQFKPKHYASTRDISQFTRQLATLLHAGVPLLQSFEILMHEENNVAIMNILQKLHTNIEGGLALNQALRQHVVFNTLYCNLVATGELAGILDKSLERLATHLEKSESLRATIRSALIYPTAVLGVASIVLAIILVFVVPAFQSIFASFGAELPWLTQQVITLSEGVQHHGLWLLTLLSISAWWVRKQVLQNSQWERFLHQTLLQLPIAGRLTRTVCTARWTRTLATLFATGVPLTEALEAVQDTTGNLLFQTATQTIQEQLIQGSSLSKALGKSGDLFPPMVAQMCRIGEESGTLEHMLEKAAEYYEHEVSKTVTRLSTLLEPFTMVVLGLLIGSLVMALYLPIFQLGQVV